MFEFNGEFKKIMSGLDSLNKRLQYHGGNQEERFIKDKLKTFKKALLYSYQSETISLEDGREFRCLINKDKLSSDYDDKIISIPFSDICLNKPMGTGIEEIGMQCGDVFKWKRTNTYWLVLLQYLEEEAYFRADIRKCDGELEINEKKYRIYTRGPVETDIKWNQKSNITWNDLNYSLIAFVPKNEETLDYFHRFKKVKINGNTWEVAVVNTYYYDGVIKVCLSETFNNKFEQEDKKVEEDSSQSLILGPAHVYPYDIVNYSINGLFNGQWKVSNKKVKILKQTATDVQLEIVSGKSGEFDLIYESNGQEYKLAITIDSLM